jgi:hypothetical protein
MAKTQKKSKRFKEELQQILHYKKAATRGSPRSLQKKKKTPLRSEKDQNKKATIEIGRGC